MKLLSENLFEFKKGLDPIDSLGLGRRAMIEEWLKKMNISNYVINDDYTININQSFELADYELFENGELPDYITINSIDYRINIIYGNLKNFKRFPKNMYGYITVTHSDINTLEGIFDLEVERFQEEYVGYDLSYNKITNFIGLPKIVKCTIWLDGNPLESIDGLPNEIYGNLVVSKKFYDKFRHQIRNNCNIHGSILYF